LRFKSRSKAEVGVPLADYVARERVERAKEVRRSGQESVAAIARAFGYANPQYFATVFKRYTGLTPTQFRERS
jgi:YesN/AraC family two-component response regulator